MAQHDAVRSGGLRNEAVALAGIAARVGTDDASLVTAAVLLDARVGQHLVRAGRWRWCDIGGRCGSRCRILVSIEPGHALPPWELPVF